MKAKKLFLFVLVVFIAFGNLYASGVNEASNKTYRILSNFGESSGNFKTLLWIIEKYKQEVNPDFKYELEVITSTDDLWEKVRLYMNGDNLPEIFSFCNGPMSEEFISRDLLVNMGQVLKDLNLYDKTNPALIDFFTSSDGNMYMVPSCRTGEFFIYNKKVFAELGLDVPTTWNEFINCCEEIKKAGYIPYAMRGADSVQYLRFLAFPGWTTTGGEFINSRLEGESFANEIGLYSANLLHTLGTSGYFVQGYESLKLADVRELVLTGVAVMGYSSSTQVNDLMNEKYDSGEIGFFGIPVVDGVEGTGTTWLEHGGKSWAVTKASYNNDPELQRFVKFWMENIHEASYETGNISWMDEEVPEGKFSNLISDLSKELAKSTVGWVSWDDKMSAATLSTVGDAAQKLAHDVITVEEFCNIFDNSVKENGK